MEGYERLVDLSYIGLIFFTSLLLSLMLTPISSRIASLLGIIDIPDPRKVHKRPVPRTGGIAIALSLTLSIIMCVKMAPFIKGFLSGAGVVVLVGIWDDKFSIPPKVKFLGEILAALIFIGVTGHKLSSLGDILGIGELKLESLELIITIIGIVGIMNAINLADGLDGLAGGMASIASAFMFVFAYTHSCWFIASVTVILIGVVLGFLRYNTHPAQIFMGDTGSLLLGYSLGTIAVSLVHSTNGPYPIRPISMAIILAIPIVDTIWVMITRLKKGHGIFYPDKNHLHHRLLNIGLTHGGAVTVIYLLMTLFGVLAWILRNYPEYQQFYLALGLVISIYLLINILEKRNITLRKGERPFKKSKWKRTLVSLTGKSVRIVTPVFLVMLLGPFLLLPPPEKIYGLLSLCVALFIVIFFPWQGGKERMPIAHALLYLACFSILVVYEFSYPYNPFINLYLFSIGAGSFIWVSARVLFKRKSQVLLPSSFEVLLIIFSWFIPFIYTPSSGLGEQIRHKIILICLYAIPLLASIKVMLRRHARRNKWIAITFITFFTIIGIRSFLHY